jgi:hypothetical protein
VSAEPAEPAEWTDCYEGRARCPQGHEFAAAWYDTKRADQTCPECGTVFEATWRGFGYDVEPEVVIIDSRKVPGRDAA